MTVLSMAAYKISRALRTGEIATAAKRNVLRGPTSRTTLPSDERKLSHPRLSRAKTRTFGSGPASLTERAIGFEVLANNDVHVWRVTLSRNLDRLRSLECVLSADEHERAARFRFTKDRCQFIEARVALRFILSRYVDRTPGNIEFTSGIHGKPELRNSDLRFNLSRREGLALIAVTRGREVGVDVERVLEDFPVSEIAESNFSAVELATLKGLPLDQQREGFFNCWTRKEAYVKARGAGLLFPLKQFDVSFGPGERAKLLAVRDDQTSLDHWTLNEIPVRDGYVAALAVNGAGLTVSCRDWSD